MFIKLNPSKIEQTVARLSRNGITITGGVVDVTESGIRLSGTLANNCLTTNSIVNVSKNCAAVELNPAISEMLGYQPGGPTYLHVSQFGNLEFTFQDKLDADLVAAIGGLPWVVELHLVPVTFLPD